MIKKFLTKVLSEDTLSKYQWYRKQRGGFWGYDGVLGWRQRSSEHWINNDLQLFAMHPELYRHGKDIEDYRSKEIKVKHALHGSGWVIADEPCYRDEDGDMYVLITKPGHTGIRANVAKNLELEDD